MEGLKRIKCRKHTAAKETIKGKANLSWQFSCHDSKGWNYCGFETKELISDHSENVVFLFIMNLFRFFWTSAFSHLHHLGDNSFPPLYSELFHTRTLLSQTKSKTEQLAPCDLSMSSWNESYLWKCIIRRMFCYYQVNANLNQYDV